MADETEAVRREMVAKINTHATEREELEAKHGQVWDTKELQQDYDVSGFLAPFISVTRKSDGVKGSMLFQASPRFYYGFKEA
jgi:hypothetical protein